MRGLFTNLRPNPRTNPRAHPHGDAPAAPDRSSRLRSAGAGLFAARNRLSLSMFALALLAGLAVLVFDARGPLVRPLENAVRDTFVRALASRTPDPRIGLVDIDEESLRRVGPWPWPRRELAELAERLVSTWGAGLVVFDLVLPEPASGDDSVGDARLAAIARERLLVSAQAFDYVARDLPVEAGVPGGASVPASSLSVPVAAATGHVAGFAALSAGSCVGNVGFSPDIDGQVRRLPLLTDWRGERYPTLALAALLCARDDIDTAALIASLPIDASGQWLLRFGRAPEAFDAVPAHAVLDAAQPAQPDRRLRGRIVLVGSSALGLSDRVATPLSSSMAGVLVHAGALGDLLDAAESTSRPAAASARSADAANTADAATAANAANADEVASSIPAARSAPAANSAPPATPPWPTAAAWSTPLAWTAAIAWLLGSTLLLWRTIGRAKRLRSIAAALAFALAGWLGLSAWVVSAGRALPVSAPLWSYAFLLLVQLPFEWSAAQSRVRARTRLLSRYVARPVLDELLARESDDPLSTRHAEISVLIADMQDYTRTTAYSTLEETAALTREFLDCLTRPVLEGMGTLDKYTGDGLVAFWGAPLPVADHAPRALRAALGIHAAVAQFNERRVARGELPVRVRIGLATGRALVGDLGTPFRSTYTAVGDVINLASRLQEAARDFDDDIVASRAFTDACPQTVFRPIGTISPRGLQREEVFSPQRPERSVG